MELECAKYGEKMDADQAMCRHPGDYCQHRTSCMIQFMERENRGNNQPTPKTEEHHDE
ncbi:MAG: RNA polymerase II-associated protein [Candidatus Electrothrix sp. MAN1_4]|nr:RNA polymerase II-associated protein [Candidatus Electrothrix sp. MAN1_4]